MVKRIQCKVLDSAPAIAPVEPWPWNDDNSTTVLNDVSCSCCGTLLVTNSIPPSHEPGIYQRPHLLDLGLVVDCYV